MAQDPPRNASRKPHEDRAVRCLDVFVGVDGTPEVGIPRVGASIDGVWHIGALDGTLGPLAPLLCHRVVGVEFYSGSAPPGAASDAIFKGGWLAKAWWRTPGAARHGIRPPALVVLTSGRLGSGFEGPLFTAIAPGVRHAHMGAEFELVTVSLAELPLENGTTGLHMLRTPSDDGGRRALLAFIADPTVGPDVRARIEVEIMNGIIPSTASERMTVAERVRAEGQERGIAIGEQRGIAIGEQRGIAIGEQRGIAIGERQARESLLAQVRAGIGPDAAGALEDIDDFDTLCARVLALLATRR